VDYGARIEARVKLAANLNSLEEVWVMFHELAAHGAGAGRGLPGRVLEAAFGGVRHLLGAQIDLLPPLMVYAGLCTGLTTVTLLALCGGLWFDSLSANPLGVTVFPLFAIAWPCT